MGTPVKHLVEPGADRSTLVVTVFLASLCRILQGVSYIV